MAQTLKEKLASIIPGLRQERQAILKQHGDKKISEVTIAQAFGGMRGIKGQICDTSVVSPDEGLIIRGQPVLKLKDKLPEEIFWLLVTGSMPSAEEVKGFQDQLRAAGEVPA